jgi:hypothetical protein
MELLQVFIVKGLAAVRIADLKGIIIYLVTEL